ncbi:MAG: hypothetical protein ACKOU7_02425 [Ferruginibacter sp.]
MKKVLFTLFIAAAVCSCSNHTAEHAKEAADNRIALRTDTINVVKLTDTLVIYESTCRGCAYETSTNFAISDSMDIIKLADIVTTDNSPADMDGGSISKDLVLVPQKTGVTSMKLFKFWKQEKTAEDSARFTTYKIEVKQ